MSDYGNDFVTLTDEDGNEEEFEHVDTVELNGETYMAFVPADANEDEDTELVILKLVNEGTDDEALESIEDEDELESVFGTVLKRLDSELYEEGVEDGEEEEDD